MREMASRTKSKLNNLNYRAREVGLTERLEQSDIDALKEFYGYTCLKCGFNPAISPDHVKPLSKGGSNSVDNLQLLCDSCNKSKGDDETDYRQGRILTREIVADLAKSQNEPQKDRRIKHDWLEIEGEYITTDISTRDLAARFGVPYPTLRDYAIAHDWDKERKEYRSKVVADTKAITAETDVSSRIMILQAAREALNEWRKDRGKQTTGELAKILELAARVEGLQLDNKTLTLKDWRDAAAKGGDDSDDIQQFATDAASDYYGGDSGSDTDTSAGWTD